MRHIPVICIIMLLLTSVMNTCDDKEIDLIPSGTWGHPTPVDGITEDPVYRGGIPVVRYLGNTRDDSSLPAELGNGTGDVDKFMFLNSSGQAKEVLPSVIWDACEATYDNSKTYVLWSFTTNKLISKYQMNYLARAEDNPNLYILNSTLYTRASTTVPYYRVYVLIELQVQIPSQAALAFDTHWREDPRQ